MGHQNSQGIAFASHAVLGREWLEVQREEIAVQSREIGFCYLVRQSFHSLPGLTLFAIKHHCCLLFAKCIENTVVYMRLVLPFWQENGLLQQSPRHFDLTSESYNTSGDQLLNFGTDNRALHVVVQGCRIALCLIEYGLHDRVLQDSHDIRISLNAF